MKYRDEDNDISNPLDGRIDALLRADAPEVSPNFADSLADSIRAELAAEAAYDARADALLAKLRPFPDITEKTIARIKSAKPAVVGSVFACISAAAVAACAAFAVLGATAQATLPRGTITADDFAQMSQIDTEIDSIAALVMQEELVDLLK